MATVLPFSTYDVQYDNAKFRRRSLFKVITQAMLTSGVRRNCRSCGIGKLLALLMIAGLAFLTVAHTNPGFSSTSNFVKQIGGKDEKNLITEGATHLQSWKAFWRKPPRLPPRLPPMEKGGNGSLYSESLDGQGISEWTARQTKVVEAFQHAWTGYKNYAMGSDELMPLSKRGVDGLGGLGATIVDSLDTAMIMGLDDIVQEAGSWIEKSLPARLNEKGQVPTVYLERAKDLAHRLLSAFTSSPTAIPFSDVVLRERSAHPAPDGLSSTSEVTSVQLEFWYLSKISGDPKYGKAAMKVLEHFKTLPK